VADYADRRIIAVRFARLLRLRGVARSGRLGRPFFFDRLSRFSRIINVESLQATAFNRKGSEYSITTSFTMKTFIYGEVKEVKQEGARR